MSKDVPLLLDSVYNESALVTVPTKPYRLDDANCTKSRRLRLSWARLRINLPYRLGVNRIEDEKVAARKVRLCGWCTSHMVRCAARFASC